MNQDNFILGAITGANEIETAMIKQAFDYAKKVVFSDQFKVAVLAFAFTSTNGMTNQQIYDSFTQTKIVINVDDYSGSWKANHIWHTEGYENGDGAVHANRHFIFNAIDMGSLILHEGAHELGFHHLSSREYTSVPYGMNRIFMQVGRQLGFIPQEFIAA